MKRPLNPSPYHQKWALFVVLTASLGFTLSMNPDHFNNIARHEIGNLHTVDMASSPSQSDVRKADNKIDEDAKTEGAADSKEENSAPSESKSTSSSKKTPPGEKDTLPRNIYVHGNGRTYEVSFSKENQVARAKFKAVDHIEGKSCPVCGLSVQVQSSLDKVDDLATEMAAIAEGRLNAAEASGKSEEKISPQKKGEATEVDLAKWAEKCESTADDNKLDCHKSRLIELSKYLKNSSETDNLVREYFTTYLQDELKLAFYNRTIKETSLTSCEGQVIYMGSYGRVGCQSDALEKAGDIADGIMNGLRAGNGKSVVAALTKMRAGSFSAQLKNSQILAAEGNNEKNMMKLALGFRGMDLVSQTVLLNQMNSAMSDSISGMQGTAGQKSLLDSLVKSNFYDPVNSMLQDMRNFIAGSNSTTPGQTRNLLDFQVPSLADDRGGLVPVNPSNPGYTPGLPGNISAAVLAARINAPLRSSNLQQLFGGLTSYPQSNTSNVNSWLQPNNLVPVVAQPGFAPNTQQNFLTNPQMNPSVAIPNGRTSSRSR